MMEAKNKLKVPPHSIESEQSVLGAMLIDNKVLYPVIQILEDKHFYSVNHQKIYQAMKMMFRAKKSIDLITVNEFLESTNEIEFIGGFSYLAELAKNVPSSANVTSYAEIIVKHWNGREIIGACHEAVETCFSSDQYETARHGLYDSLGELFKENLGKTTISDGKELVAAFTDELERNVKSDNGITGFCTGDKHLDEKTGGFQKGDYIGVAARSGGGKTTYAMNRLAHFVRMNRRSLFFSMEMKKSKAMMKLTSDMASVPLAALKSGNLNELQWGAIGNMMEFIKDSKLHIDDSSGQTIDDIERKARQLKARYGELDLIVIDYVQRLKIDSSNMYQELTNASNRLKDLFMELDCVGIVLAQLKKNSVGMPNASDLRETGAIENDSDVLLFLHTPSEDLKPHKGMNTLQIFNKVRFGESEIKCLRNELDFQRFTPVDDDYEEGQEDKF